MARTLRWGRLTCGAGLAALLLLAAIGVGPAAADVQPFEVAEYRESFEVPAEQAEESLEVQAQGAEADVVGGLEERLGENYAGVWFDNEKDEYVVPLLPDASGATVNSEFARADLGSAEFRISQAQSSWEELEAAQAEIDAALLPRIEEGLVQTSLDPRTNAVAITRVTGADAGTLSDHLRRLAASSSVKVEIQVSETESLEGDLEACAKPFCGAPLRGGVEIFNPSNPESGCTAGFPALGKDGTKYLVTAGHCVEDYPGAPQNLSWSSKDSALQTHGIGAIAQWEHTNLADWAKINASGSWWDTGSWPTKVAYWGTNNEYPITGEAASLVGSYVCHSGAVSGTTCGSVTALNVTHDFGLGARQGLTELSGACSSGGDSGGPYFSGNIAMGIHIGSADVSKTCGDPLFYYDITKATAALGVSVAPPAQATETTINVPPGEVLHGQPGYVTVNGKVQAGAYSVAGKYVNVNYSKETSPGVWTYMNTSHPTLNSEGAYSYPYWQVAAGNWRVRTVFPGGEGLAESVSPFQYFTIKLGYRFVWRHSGKCMTLSENSAANGKPIIQWPCFSPPSPGDGQVFTLVPMAGGYELKINSTGKCVDVTSASVANGAKLQQWDCLGAGQTNQIWSLVELAGQPGWFAWIAKHSGRCADVPSSSTANGAWFQQWDCLWTGNQQFSIQAIS
jgi:hypothetical protein